MIDYRRVLVRTGLAAAAAVALGLGITAVANAHVTIRPDNDTTGSYAKLTVRVPNESDTAGTVRLQLDLPADTPFPSVRVQPHPGWSAELVTTTFDQPVTVGDYTLTEAVTSITWTAAAGVRIGPGEFDEFGVSVGPLPDPGTYVLPATQTYDDGTVVAWDAEPVEGGEEPEHPAPVLTVVEASAGEEHHASAPDEPTDASSNGVDGLARGVGIGGVVVGAAGLGVGAMALRRRSA